MMRSLLLFFGLASLAACSDVKTNTGQRLDFVGSSRLTASNKTTSTPGDTLASRIYADASGPDQILTRLRITVTYSPRRDPFLYPTPVSSINRDLIDKNPDAGLIYLDTLLTANPKNLLFTSVFGVRTTTGSERWQYDLLGPGTDTTVQASRAFRVSMRRSDSLNTYHDYTLRLVAPANGRGARRFLQLKAGLALPAYSVVNTTTSRPASQAALQKMTDLIVLSDGLTLVSPDLPALSNLPRPGLSLTRWPLANRRGTRIYPAAATATTFAGLLTDEDIRATYNAAAANPTASGQSIGPVQAGQVYAFRTDETTPRYGVMLIVSVPVSTATTTTTGLQIQVRMAKQP
jgi:hypothetical protein